MNRRRHQLLRLRGGRRGFVPGWMVHCNNIPVTFGHTHYTLSVTDRAATQQAGRTLIMHAAKAALCHHCDVIQSRDVIDHMTIRLSIDDFLYVFNRNQT